MAIYERLAPRRLNLLPLGLLRETYPACEPGLAMTAALNQCLLLQPMVLGRL